jgi:hypothetical protein
MELDAILPGLLMAGSLSCAIWLCLPDVLLLLGMTCVRRGILGGPEDVRSGPAELVTEEIAQELDALGFVPAGLYWEQLPAHKMFREVIFVSRRNDCFASVYRLFGNSPSCVAFKTSFGDGATVFTQNYVGGIEANEETLRAGGLRSEETTTLEERTPLAEVLEEHRHRVSLFVLAGHPLLPAVTIDDYVEAEQTYMDHPTVRRMFHGNVAWLFPWKLALLGSGPALFAAIWGVHPVGIWAILLAASLSMLLFRYYGYPLLEALDKMLPAEKKH